MQAKIKNRFKKHLGICMNDYHINGFLSEMKVLGMKSSSLIDLLETIAVRVYKPQIILLSMPFF